MSDKDQGGRNTCPPCAAELDKLSEPHPGRITRQGEWCLFCGCIWRRCSSIVGSEVCSFAAGHTGEHSWLGQTKSLLGDR